jgi:phosphoribosylamine--glycine ligase
VTMKVHVIGGGGREHALRTVLSRTAEVIENPDDADLIVVGPEIPLVAGIADEWRNKGKFVYGPGRDGAQLEGSKAFMKDFVERAGVPSAKHGSFTDADDAIAFMQTLPPPYVVKTDGLAAGKGVLVTNDFDEACNDIRDKLSGDAFGDSGRTVVVEEGMVGPELSIMYVFDGKRGLALAPAQDYKRINDGDQGANTGGMGAYSPVPIANDAIIDATMDRIIEPTCTLLQKDGIDYRGTLYAGLMLTSDGPKLIEYNVRFGDPETQVILPRFAGDLAQLLMSVAAGDLQHDGPVAVDDAAVTVCISSRGYPETSSKGDVITGVDEANAMKDVMVFEAGTARNQRGELVTNGGRVLNVTALGGTIAQARERAYEAVGKIHFDGMHFRTDIASVGQ